MSNSLSKAKYFVFLGFSLLMLSNCVGPLQHMGAGGGSTDSTLSSLEASVAEANARIDKLEMDLSNANSKVTALETQLNANQDEPYLKVLVPILNIRTDPTTTSNNILAKAEQGAYLRKIGYASDAQDWAKVEFMVDNFPYIGYVVNNEEYLKEEIYDPITFSSVYNRKLITHQWQTEAALEMKRNNFRTLGVYVESSDNAQKDRFLGQLAKHFREHSIYVKPLLNYDMSQIAQHCTQNKVEGIMKIEMMETESANTQLEIRLFDKQSIILYSASIPLQAIDLSGSLGRGY